MGESRNGNEVMVADGLLNIRQACDFLQVSRSSLYSLMESGALPYTKIARSRRVPKLALVRLATDGLVGAK
jgi:excisionase family DNA binding protein